MFQWIERVRRPLEEGINVWTEYMKVIKQVEGDRYCMIEFVKDDTPEQFLKDAEVLKKIVG